MLSYGIKSTRVNPRWTSSYCSQCGKKGIKITESRHKKMKKAGRLFHCKVYGFTADGDYIASLNIYRMYQEQKRKRYSLKQTKTVPYMAAGIPLNRPSGETTLSSGTS
ncbi:MAG: zinc ribbon domain-containing protein [Promethearchaeota archaeon]